MAVDASRNGWYIAVHVESPFRSQFGRRPQA
jgi:hypothetical protein